MSTSGKAKYFEGLVIAYLTSNGYKPRPMAETGLQTLGRFTRKGREYAADAHAKAARDGFWDTGIDYAKVRAYIRFEKSARLDVLLFFGDHKEGVVYCATLDDLLDVRMNPEKCKPGEYPRKEGTVLFFPRAAMKVAWVLTDEQRARLTELTRNDDKQLSLIAPNQPPPPRRGPPSRPAA